MNAIASYADYDGLLKIINAAYHVDAEQIRLHRDLIGRVYFVDGRDKNVVLKLYRPMDSGSALQSIAILQYLKQNDYPAVSIIPTSTGEMSVLVHTPEGPSVGIVSDRIEGITPDIETETESIGMQIGRLHRLMQEYPRELPRRTKAQYIDDYVAIMEEMGYDRGRIRELAEYGEELWTRLGRLPQGFCHGDMHTGNMLQTRAGTYVLFDFDEASGDYPGIDVAYLSDATDFNHFAEDSHENTMHRFERFYKGYARERPLSEAEIDAIPDIIAIRHYTILGRIIRRQGTGGISRAFLDEQYEWLLDWRNLCERERRSHWRLRS